MLRHEAMHVYDGLHTYWLNPSQHGTLEETRAGVGEAIGHADIRYYLLAFLRLGIKADPANRGADVHGVDYLYIPNRLAYWLWRDADAQKEAGLRFPKFQEPIKQFSDLPPEIRSAVWSGFPSVPDAVWNRLYRHVWDELQSLNNPFLQGAGPG